MDFCNLKLQYMTYKDEIDRAIQNVIDNATFINGDNVKLLEQRLSDFVGSTAITCASGTDALHLALLALGIKPGDEVITSPFTFVATAEVIALIGAKPVFVDISDEDFNINTDLIEAAITEKTKVIIPVSLFGQPSDMEKINIIAKKYNLTVVEDASQSFGAKYKGRYSCNLSTLATTSFFPSKPFGCYGDGGAVFTTDKKLAKKIRILKNHGQHKKYHHSIIGINSRLDSIQAAILSVKLNHYEKEIKLRKKVAAYYTKLLNDNVKTPKVLQDRSSVWAQYTIRVQNRTQLETIFKSADVPYAIYYPKPLHLQKAFAYLDFKVGDFPVSENMCKEVLSLPMNAFLMDDEIQFITNTINTR